MAKTLSLTMQASIDAGGMSKGAAEAERACNRVGDAAKKTASDVRVLRNIAIGGVVAKGIGIAADAFASASRAALSYAASVSHSVDATQDLAERTGMGVESLQALQFAAKLSGVENVTTAVQKLGLAIGQAAESGNMEAFTRLGLNFQELQSMAPEDQFRAISFAIAALPSEAERAAAAVKIFGRSGVELLPLFNKNLAEAEARARRLGIVLSEQQVGAIADMNDSLDVVRKTFDGIIGQVISYLAPAVTEVAETFLSFVEGFEGGGTGIAEAIAENLIEAGKFLSQVFDKFIGGLGWFLEGLGSWVSNDLKKIGAQVRAFGEAGYAASAAAAAESGFRNRNSPEAQAAKRQRDAQRAAARQAAAAASSAEREASIQKKINDASTFKQENAVTLSSKSNEALRANDIRTSEGMAQFLALASGREDPAIAENRKQNQKLQEIINELRNGNQAPVDIIGAAA